jgi:hypothetical protein
MATITIDIDTTNLLDVSAIQISLQKLAKNVDKNNLMFLAEMSLIPNINEKFKKKQTLIKTFIK